MYTQVKVDDLWLKKLRSTTNKIYKRARKTSIQYDIQDQRPIDIHQIFELQHSVQTLLFSQVDKSIPAEGHWNSFSYDLKLYFRHA